LVKYRDFKKVRASGIVMDVIGIHYVPKYEWTSNQGLPRLDSFPVS